jgi:hypothetical protein
MTRHPAAWGLPVSDTSETIQMFRVVLEEYRALCQRRKQLESDVVTALAAHPDFVGCRRSPVSDRSWR